jgi:hypothetical protein
MAESLPHTGYWSMVRRSAITRVTTIHRSRIVAAQPETGTMFRVKAV